MGWKVVEQGGTVAALHALVPEPRRQIWLCHPTDRAVVLGSAQASAVDPAAAAELGLEVVRRRSGGGAVLVEPGAQAWIDLIIPAGDPLWHDDIGVAAGWVGEVWAGALAGLGISARRHEGAMVRTPWSELVCFAGLGAGELTAPDGAKLLGLSQRRTRGWARFQTAVLVHWEPDDLVSLLVDPQRRPTALTELADAARGVGHSVGRLEQAFLAELDI